MRSKQRSHSGHSRGAARRSSGQFANDSQQVSEWEQSRPLEVPQGLSNLQPDSIRSQRGVSKDFANDVERVAESGDRGGQRSDDGSVERPGKV
jgi:general stress protein YciG